MNNLLPFLMVFVTSALLTSGIWLTAYFVGVKPNIARRSDDSQDHQTSYRTTTTAGGGGEYTPTTAPPETPDPGPLCTESCSYELVESMPSGLYEGANVLRFNSTADAWMKLMDMAEESVYITAFYWFLLANDTGNGFEDDESALAGKEVYDKLIETGRRGVKIRINQDTSSAPSKYPFFESAHLVDLGLPVEVYSLNFTKWFGGGVLHTKGWIVDDKHFYLGSANHDWRSLTQVKELGIAAYNCPCLTSDLKKIFEVYSYMGEPGQSLPSQWPSKFHTQFNSHSPMHLRMNNEENLSAYFTSSPPGLVPYGREHDGESIVRAIEQAEEFVYISVMDYAPVTMFQKSNYYWPLIDDALRHAAFDRRLHIRILMSNWPSTRPQLFSYLHSLRALDSGLPCIRYYDKQTKKYVCKEGTKGSIEIKLFEVPPYKVKIPFARVNHAKYMVTEKTSVICTSNWSADYFITTGGISLVAHATDSTQKTKLIEDMRKLHERDWFSEYAVNIDEYSGNGTRIDKLF